MQNPFTTTFSKTPQYTYVTTDSESEIVENFRYDIHSESVYKITGVRGSGKTVTLSKVEECISENEFKEMGWIVYRLNPSRDLLNQFASMLYKSKLEVDYETAKRWRKSQRDTLMRFRNLENFILRVEKKKNLTIYYTS